MTAGLDYDKAIELIEASNSLLLATHRKPDGDACGCLLALRRLLQNLGKKVTAVLPTPAPQWYEFLFDREIPVLGRDIQLEDLVPPQAGPFELLVIVDTNSLSQLGPFAAYLEHNTSPVLVIDHHATGDGLGQVQLIEPAAAATGLVMRDLFRHAGWTIDPAIARNLFVAIASDTGWFQFTNTDSRVFQVCAELVDAGAVPAQLYQRLYSNFTPARFRLMAVILNSLELHFDDRFALQALCQADFDRAGASYSDTENLISECYRIQTVQVAALLVELADGRIRCSLRSRSAVDVCEIARNFGGGGHKAAAGTYLPGPLDHAKQLILQRIRQAFEDLSTSTDQSG